MYIGDTDVKANLNIYFAEQSIFDEHLATLPDFINHDGPTLDSINFSPSDILNTLTLVRPQVLIILVLESLKKSQCL